MIQFFESKKKMNIIKLAHADKKYASSYNVEILNYFYPKLQVNDTESEINNKLNIDWFKRI